jgi:hypothetical protein
VLFTVTLPVNAAADAFPFASLNEPVATVTTAVPPTDCAAVNVAVYDVLLEDWKLLRVPKVDEISASANVVVASLAVKVIVDVPPELTEVGLALTVMVGTTPSITNALFCAILLATKGIVVDVIALPAVSSTVPIVNESAVKSAETSPDCTVYVPVNEVPAETAVNTTALSTVPVSNVTVIVLPERTASLVVALIAIVEPIPYEPLAVDEVNAVTIGTTPSTTKAFTSAILFAPLGTVVEVIALPAVSLIVPIVKLETVKSEDDCPTPTV